MEIRKKASQLHMRKMIMVERTSNLTLMYEEQGEKSLQLENK